MRSEPGSTKTGHWSVRQCPCMRNQAARWVHPLMSSPPLTKYPLSTQLNSGSDLEAPSISIAISRYRVPVVFPAHFALL